ncbi:MAG: hypothetical protein KC481_11795 [Acidimicrobiaceae bacterium]|nr:hypothetical protein [Acidimicrobiaceae bacterium]MDB4818580.1 hypothetical protein [Acidimicrobiales bacterium]MDC1389050.1 hypothetical protein [Acidimicrobiales bacterium]MDG1086096.1 hypothetical protein [Acidimicrobiales bacterium]
MRLGEVNHQLVAVDVVLLDRRIEPLSDDESRVVICRLPEIQDDSVAAYLNVDSVTVCCVTKDLSLACLAIVFLFHEGSLDAAFRQDAESCSIAEVVEAGHG